MHVRSGILCERAFLRMYDLCAMCTGMPSLQKMLVILWSSRSEMQGIFHSVLEGRESS